VSPNISFRFLYGFVVLPYAVKSLIYPRFTTLDPAIETHPRNVLSGGVSLNI